MDDFFAGLGGFPTWLLRSPPTKITTVAVIVDDFLAGLEDFAFGGAGDFAQYGEIFAVVEVLETLVVAVVVELVGGWVLQGVCERGLGGKAG